MNPVLVQLIGALFARAAQDQALNESILVALAAAVGDDGAPLRSLLRDEQARIAADLETVAAFELEP